MQNQELTFPVDWEFRVIASDRAGMAEDLRKALFTLGFTAAVAHARDSSTGRYRTYGVKLTLPNREALNQVSYALSQIAGVRMVM